MYKKVLKEKVLEKSIINGIFDRHLSQTAKGVYAQLLKMPEDVSLSYADMLDELDKCSSDSKDAVMSAVMELTSCGYIKLERIDVKDSSRVRFNIYLFDRPSAYELEKNPFKEIK